MSNQEVIDLSSDEEIDVADLIDVKPVLLSSIAQDNSRSNLVNEVPRSFCVTSQASLHADGFSPGSGLPGPSMRICRQFWKSGDYEVGKALGPMSRSGPSRLRIHPKFLHSNATSHKWAFGAIAELLDNAVDEVHKGATLVIVDKFVNPRNGDPALLIQDDGSGMDPESMRRCMSFGFSDKQSDSSIGQYGNGFKTSTMRLGADVIVFSRCMNKRVSTQSVGLLSYTFLRQTGCDDIVVPVVDYEFNSLTGAFGRLIRHDEKQFLTNLSTLLKWSLFSTEVELLNQFNDIGHHGTKIIVFNLWLNEDGGMELDFDSDPEDILISGAQRNVEKKTIEHNLSKKYVANLLHYSLRAYSSVLYLRVPENFKIVLRGQVVKHHPIAKDLMYRECIKYKPQVGGIIEGEVVTTIGYLMGAPSINVHGFNVYHRNRLILPFWRVAHNSYGKGRGVVGVLEANFIKPTHDKQDFEKSTLFQKLESRLKEMTYEYWDFHCHLVGYTKSRNPEAINRSPANQTPNLRTTNGATTVAEASQGHLLGYTKSKNPAAINPAPANRTPKLRTSNGSTTVSEASQALLRSSSISGQRTNGIVNSQTGLAHKRKYERDDTGAMEPLRKQVVDAGVGSSNKETRPKCNTGQKGKQAVITMMQENKKLLDKCLEYEETEKKLLDKVGKLRRELLEVQQVHKNLLEELKLMDSVKVEKP